jgi:type I restriction enzyme S subunit
VEHWQELPLEVVCTVITDGTHHSPPNGSIGHFRYITAKNLRPWGLDLGDVTWVDAATHREIYSRCPVEFEDVLYIKDGATTGLAVVNPLREPFSMLSSVALLKPNRSVLRPHYLKYWLNSPQTFSRMTADMTGSAIRRLVLRQIRNAHICLPPLEEQDRIIYKLDKYQDDIATLRKRLEGASQTLKRFRQSVLASGCSGKLTEGWRDRQAGSDEGESVDNGFPVSWRNERLETVLESSFYGPRFSAQSYSSDGIPTVRTTDMNFDGSIVLKDSPRIPLSTTELNKLRLRDGDLLITRTGATIGKCAVYESVLGPAIPSAYLIRFRLRRTEIVSRFLLLFLMSPEGQRLLTSGSTSVAQPNINARTIAEFEIPIPPMSEQVEIVRQVDALFKLADAIEKRVTAAQGRADKLVQSIMAKAFRGELVPTEAELAKQEVRDYEPASALLTRIKAEREKTIGGTKQRLPSRRKAKTN